MIDDIKQAMIDCFSIRVPDSQLYEAAKEIEELVRARTLPVYLRLCMLEWTLGQTMVNLASLRGEPVASPRIPAGQQSKPKEFCEICKKVTEWSFIGHQRDKHGEIAFALHNCLKCGATRKLSGRPE